MKTAKLFAALAVVTVVLSSSATAEAGLFGGKLFGHGCCEPEPVCCEPAPQPCCEEVVVEQAPCCEPAPVCCEADPCGGRKHGFFQRLRDRHNQRRSHGCGNSCAPVVNCGC